MKYKYIEKAQRKKERKEHYSMVQKHVFVKTCVGFSNLTNLHQPRFRRRISMCKRYT